VGELFADLELVFDLLDEADVLRVYALDVLQGELTPRRRVIHAIDRALGTLSQHIDYVIIKQLCGHEPSFHLGIVLPRHAGGIWRVFVGNWIGG
jgi:hypothetical protein